MTSEADVQAATRLRLAADGYRLWRNNTGVLTDANGRPVRYGLANDTKALNAQIKSSDLIGWRPIVVTPAHVGTTIAQFVSMECKPTDWRPALSGERFLHEQAQQRWLDLVTADGGEGRFVCTMPISA